MKYIPPKFKEKAFTCPNCGVTSNQFWALKTFNYYQETKPNGTPSEVRYVIPNLLAVKCSHCEKHSFWLDEKMIYPLTGTVPLPNEDMPEEIKADFQEAREIVNISPRGAAALLRLAIQKLCIHLGEKGENINDDIKNLVKKGLPEPIQQALDSVRVIGNNAVHPGTLDLKDDYETAYKMFGFVNVICDTLITQPKKIKEFYEFKVPENLRQAIDKRDGRSN